VSHLGEPLIIEAALNGGTPKSRNPNVPSAPDEVVEQALAVLDAGAAIVHTHIDRPKLAGEEAAERYMEAYRPILRRRPDAILYGTIGPGGSFETSFSHFAGLARGGARMGTFDPGPVNLGDQADNGLPRTSILYGNSFKDIAGLVELYRDTKLGPSFAIYEPGWLRTVLAYERAGQLPAGSLVKLYFGGRYNIFDGDRAISRSACRRPPRRSTPIWKCSKARRCRGRSPRSVTAWFRPGWRGWRSSAAVTSGSD
jgi:3-keto-5-aminohexanoate cleavage enzyme